MSNSLSLCVICKNEEDSIGTLLESVKGELFDEIIVVDTGSTDKTLDILNSYGVTVEHFEWINDFSAARNYSFSKANSDYIMWCLTPDNRILSKEGYKYITDINLGDEVYTHKGRFKKVIKLMEREVDEKILEIDTHLFNKKIKITKNHEVLAIKNYKCNFRKWCQPNCARQVHPKTGYKNCKQAFKDYSLEWVPAGDLEENDIIVFPKISEKKPIKIKYELDLSSKEKNNKISEFYLNEDLMRLFGYFLAEGFFSYSKSKDKSKNPYSICFSFNIQEKLFQRDVCEIIKNNFNIDCKTYENKEANSCVIQCNSVSLAKFFKKHLKEYSHSKDFPTDWLYLDKNYLKNLFIGWYRGDGDHVNHSEEYRGRSINESLLNKFKILLNTFNIVPYIVKDKHGLNLKIGGKQLELFKDIFKFEHTFIEKRTTSYQKYFYQDKDYIYYPIKSIKEIDYSGLVYNIEVEEDNSYIVEDMTVHNCDSDDYIKPEDYQKLVDLKPKLHESPIWLLKYEYAHDEFGKSICSFFRERIVRRDLNIKWEQPIHEYMPLVHSYKQVDIEVHHNKKDVHTKRNVEILEKIVEENPNFARNVYYLGKEYFDSGEFEKGMELLEKFVTMQGAWGENKYGAYIRMVEYNISNQNFDKAIELLLESIKIDPLKAKSYYYLGDIALTQKDFHTAIHWLRIAANFQRSEKSLDIVEPKYHTWLPNLQLCIAYNSLGKLKEAAEANEEALKYRPKDTRILNNKAIFVNSLKEDYPFRNGETLESYLADNEPIPELKKKIGWYTTHESTFASNRIRMQNISKFLSESGIASEILSPLQLNTDPDYYKKFDFIITGKYFNKEHLDLIHFWKQEGIVVICDINEDIFEFPYVKEIVQACDFTVCCSQALADRASSFSSNVAVIEDAVEYFSEVANG